MMKRRRLLSQPLGPKTEDARLIGLQRVFLGIDVAGALNQPESDVRAQSVISPCVANQTDPRERACLMISSKIPMRER